MTNIKLPLLCLVFVTALTACGGGGSSGGDGVADNMAPTASDVTVIDANAGDAVVGDNLTGDYSYADADGDDEGGTTFRWLRGGAAIEGATTQTYQLTFSDVGQSVTFEVTPLAVTGGSTGAAVASSGTTSRVPAFTNFQAATVVIGQPDFISSAGNQGGWADANTISNPYGNPGVYNGVLYLPDYSNNRLLGFDTIPTVNDASADFVIGQPDFTSDATGTTATEFSGPGNVVFDNGKMFLGLYNNNRVLIWNEAPTTGAIPADVVVGQVDMTAEVSDCTATNFNEVESQWAVNDKLIVVDGGNNRVLIWNSVPTTNNQPADIVLGQQDFVNCAENDTDNDGSSDTATASTLFYPGGVWSDGNRVVVNDYYNNRVLIWNNFPTANFQAADIVLGQSDFTQNTANDDDQDNASDTTPTARTLDRPYVGVFSNGIQLFIADDNNSRVLVWNSFPTTNFQPADIVLGQGDFTHSACDDDDQDYAPDADTTARTLCEPTGIFQVGRKLIVGDLYNNRYLIYEGN